EVVPPFDEAIQTIPPIDSAVTKYGFGAVQPSPRNIKQVNSSVATVIPEIGFDDEPTSPVSLDETVTKRKPKMMINIAPRTFILRDGTREITTISPRIPAMTHFIDISWSVRGRAPPFSSIRLPRRSESPDLSPCQIVGIDRPRLMSPPATTAPAPIY